MYSKIPVFVYNENLLTLTLCFTDFDYIKQGAVSISYNNVLLMRTIDANAYKNGILGIIIAFEKDRESTYFIYDHEELDNILKTVIRKRLNDSVSCQSLQTIKKYQKTTPSLSRLSLST